MQMRSKPAKFQPKLNMLPEPDLPLPKKQKRMDEAPDDDD